MKNFSKIALLLCVVSLSACSDEEALVRPDSKLAGKITYKGKPVPHALVIVAAPKGIAGQGNADADGNYVVEHAPVGEVQIGVNTDAGRGRMMGELMKAAQTGDKSSKPELVDIPKKYFEPTTSGLKTTVADGDTTTTFDIELK